MTKTRLAVSGLAAFALAMLGIGIELFATREVTAEAARMPFPAATQSDSLQQRAATHSRNADSNWNEAVAKNKERSRKYLDRFNNDGFVSKEKEAYMEELAKEQEPTYAATGFRGGPKN